MNKRRCLKIAARMNGLLKSELGQGIVPARMLAEPLYARDVLLVCEALRGNELAELAPRFRQALAADADGATAPRRSGFSASRFLGSLFGTPSGFGPARSDETKTHAQSHPHPQSQSQSRGWFGRSRSAAK